MPLLQPISDHSICGSGASFFLKSSMKKSNAATWLHAPPLPATQLHSAVTTIPSLLYITYTMYVVFAFSEVKQCALTATNCVSV